ncbi:hypothetical protein E4P40_24630 [Blastococcus sp. CT_GayMR20]|uniref:hypothetical protein n=1 Tax=Blastococcus sp. CT_GayMR20 TaxID=2559609 RepID=UPI00107447DC|nr:hypothetical protein [Blastococcus sp. CT_GayMR20]TFV67141.1 hypothetical protein E4P40_24630 [Blastococcus sp. CT_GayMR20]
MSRPTLDGPAAAARAALPESESAAFDRLAGAVLASSSAPLGAVLRAQLPGTAGVRWLRQEQLPPTARAAALTAEHWLSLYECWSSVHPTPGPRAAGGRRGGRPSTHGHAPGASAIPRWGQ